YTNGSITSAGGRGIFGSTQPGATLTVTGLSNVTISGTTPGDGINLSGAQFDANAATAAFETVNAGAIAVGTAGDPVGGAGVVLSGVSGDLAFGTLNVLG